MGELLALLSGGFFALAGILIRRGSEYMDRNAGHLLSVLVNAVLNCTALALRVAFGPHVVLSWVGLAYFVAAGAFTMFLGRVLWMSSIQRIGPSRAGSFKTAQVVFVLLAAVTLLGERASWLGLTGAALVLAGLMALTLERGTAGTPQGGRAGVWYGWASALSFGAGNLFRKMGMAVWTEVFAGTAIGAVVATAAALAFTNARRDLQAALRTSRGRQGALWFVGVGVASSLSQFCLYGALGMSPIWVVNMIAGTEPVLVALLSLALLRGREMLGIRLWTSVGLVTAGIAVIAMR